MADSDTSAVADALGEDGGATSAGTVGSARRLTIGRGVGTGRGTAAVCDDRARWAGSAAGATGRAASERSGSGDEGGGGSATSLASRRRGDSDTGARTMPPNPSTSPWTRSDSPNAFTNTRFIIADSGVWALAAGLAPALEAIIDNRDTRGLQGSRGSDLTEPGGLPCNQATRR